MCIRDSPFTRAHADICLISKFVESNAVFKPIFALLIEMQMLHCININSSNSQFLWINRLFKWKSKMVVWCLSHQSVQQQTQKKRSILNFNEPTNFFLICYTVFITKTSKKKIKLSNYYCCENILSDCVISNWFYVLPTREPQHLCERINRISRNEGRQREEKREKKRPNNNKNIIRTN